MTTASDDRGFPQLRPSEARLGALFRRPAALALACMAVTAGAGWFALGLLAATDGDNRAAALVDALCGSFHGDSAPVSVAMWAAMTLAMMLPTASAMIVTYAEIADTAAAKGARVVSPFVLTAGYAAVWLGFAAAASILQVVLTGIAILDHAGAPPLLSGALFAAAGLYQFSKFKLACLHRCQRPFPFFFANWSERPVGVFRLGLRQGADCLGCCWAMMLTMFAAGTMNVAWMAVLGIAMTAEKMMTTPRLSRVFGVGFLAIGIGFIAAALL